MDNIEKQSWRYRLHPLCMDYVECKRTAMKYLHSFVPKNKLKKPVTIKVYRFIRMAETEGAQGLHYFVLLIFTSGGSIADSKELMNAILGAAKMPISIIFIGVGTGDFDEFYRIAGSRKNVVVAGSSPNRDFIEVSLTVAVIKIQEKLPENSYFYCFYDFAINAVSEKLNDT